MHLLRTLPKEVSRSTATKVENGISEANRRSPVRERRVKKDRMLVEKIQIEFVSTTAEHPMQWVKKQKKKNRAPAQASFERRGNHCQSKPKEGKVEVRDLRGILVGSSRAQSQAVGRSIYIYIYISPMTKVQVNT